MTESLPGRVRRSFGLLLLAAALFAPGRSSAQGVEAACSSDVIIARAQQDVDSLTSPVFAGRGYGRGGHTRAAALIRRRFRAEGLRPATPGYYQPVPVRTRIFPQAPSLRLDGSDLQLGTDFLPHPASANGSAAAVPVVYAGTGLLLSGAGLNDYAGMEARVKGRVVLVEADVPDSISGRAGIRPEWLTREARIGMAHALGAAAVIFLEKSLTFGGATVEAPIPVFQVLASERYRNVHTASFSLAGARLEAAESQNVLGMVRGTAVPDSVLIIGAHYDHFGALGPTFYFPGANDNAGGTALLLALAEYFSQHPVRYSLLFAAFTGEEIGLVGSAYFVAHPAVDLSRVAAMLNFDMVTSAQNGIMVFGGTDSPELFSRLERVNAAVEEVPLAGRANRPNSDQYPFAKAGLPAFFFIGKDGAQPYHHAADVKETLDWGTFDDVYRLGVAFIEELSGGEGEQ